MGAICVYTFWVLYRGIKHICCNSNLRCSCNPIQAAITTASTIRYWAQLWCCVYSSIQWYIECSLYPTEYPLVWKETLESACCNLHLVAPAIDLAITWVWKAKPCALLASVSCIVWQTNYLYIVDKACCYKFRKLQCIRRSIHESFIAICEYWLRKQQLRELTWSSSKCVIWHQLVYRDWINSRCLLIEVNSYHLHCRNGCWHSSTETQ